MVNRNKYKISLYLLLLIILTQSCKFFNTSLSPADFVDWVENKENGLKVEKDVNNLRFTIQYKPHSYIAIKELKKTEISAEELENKISEINELQYFNLIIKNLTSSDDILKLNSASIEEYQQRVAYYSFELQKEIKLANCGDTLQCSLFHFERSYGITPHLTFLLGFPSHDHNLSTPDQICDKILMVNERIFNTGNILLKIDKQNIINIPKITTQ